MTENTKKHFDEIVDCISGGDGGVSFLQLKRLLTEMENQAEAGDTTG